MVPVGVPGPPHTGKTMKPSAYLVVNVDSDPDPVRVYQNDASLLAKYQRLKEILAEHAGGTGAWTVLTGPLCRDRFFEPPFIDFWRHLRDDGADLVLHPEEDLYGPPPGKAEGRCSYYDPGHMRPIILSKARAMQRLGIPFAAYRGGYHGFTPAIGEAIKAAGIGIELSCAPGIEWPEKAADWGNAPLSAFYMSNARPSQIADPCEEAPLFEIPWAWDGIAPGTSRRFVVGENYMINEFSTLPAMRLVWDTITRRAVGGPAPQIVSMICHTFTMGEPEYEDRLIGILDYVAAHGAQFVTPRSAQAIFDGCRGAAKNVPAGVETGSSVAPLDPAGTGSRAGTGPGASMDRAEK